jgi:uncharacterized membrane protein
MNALRMCLNWKVLAGLATVGIGVYVLAPELIAEALPVLLLAACPLSMLLMMWSMQRTQGQDERTTQETDDGLAREERIARLRAQQAALADRIGELEREETRPTGNRRRR